MIPAPASDGPAPRLSGRRLLAALGLWLLAFAAAAGATVLAVRQLDAQWGSNAGTMTPVLVAEAYALLIAALWFALRRDFRRAVALRRFSVRDVAIAAVAAVAPYVVIGLLQGAVAPRSWSAALAILRGMGSDDGRLASAGPIVAAVILVRACVLAALGEELLFRGALHTWLRQRLSATATIVITSTAFASIHGFPAILPLAFALGVGLGWVRERSGSTIPTIIVHAVHNALMMAASYALTGWTARLPPWSTP